MTLRGGKDSANGSQGANSIASIFSSGEAQLLIVAALYGSLTVSFRLLYGTEGPPAPSMASLVRGIIAAACFVPTIMKKPTTEEESKGRGASLFLAALELSWWNAGAQGLQNAGLIFTEASRASFLTQTSVVLTPILSLFFGEKVGGNVWGACVLALFGVVTISRAESPAAAAAAAAHASAGINIGDLLCLAGAACWSMYILRLTQMMQSGKHCATALQAYKTCLLAGWYAVWVAYDASRVVGGMWALWPAAGSLLPLAIICYSAIGPGAVADVMQSRAQEKVKASQVSRHSHSTPPLTPPMVPTSRTHWHRDIHLAHALARSRTQMLRLIDTHAPLAHVPTLLPKVNINCMLVSKL
jgi:drug/metabolite transporter (DMT)-like permease